MRYINSKEIDINLFSQTTTLRCPKFSEILNVHVKGSKLIITYSSISNTNLDNNENSYKSVNFKILYGLYLNNSIVDDSYEYFNTLKVEQDDTINFYHIFIENIKTLDEKRELKLVDILD